MRDCRRFGDFCSIVKVASVSSSFSHEMVRVSKKTSMIVASHLDEESSFAITTLSPALSFE